MMQPLTDRSEKNPCSPHCAPWKRMFSRPVGSCSRCVSCSIAADLCRVRFIVVRSLCPNCLDTLHKSYRERELNGRCSETEAETSIVRSATIHGATKGMNSFLPWRLSEVC